jgi:hypothetical protein
MKYNHILKPLSPKIVKYDFIGFDVETYGDNNKFYMGGLWSRYGKKETYEVFYDREEMIKHILDIKPKNKYIVATNLSFDLTVLFYKTKYWNDLKLIHRAGDIIYAKIKTRKGTIKFIDTMNYAPFSVEKQGKLLEKANLIKDGKLKKPSFWLPIYKDGELVKYEIRKPRETPKRKSKEVIELERYNRQDCKISSLFMYLIQQGINDAGGTLKITIASTSFDIWRRQFLKTLLLKEEHVLNDPKIKDFIFEAYYGGRTEVYKRGMHKNLYYYDINSLYPSVMVNPYPKPNSVRKISVPRLDYIRQYEGVSNVIIESPGLDKPFLPVREDKLIFPNGIFKGTYNHNELRKALELGYKIHKITKQIIYSEKFLPFKRFVETFYKKRMSQKATKNPLEVSTKLILNSLYGKFGQRRVTKTEIFSIKGMTYQQVKDKLRDNYVKNGSEIMQSYEEEFNGVNVYPIFASYTASYARILMYPYINNPEVVYTDTDSIFTTENIIEPSNELGKMKLEATIDQAEFYRPKLYEIFNNGEYTTKVKGLSRCTHNNFQKIKQGLPVDKFKISKLKESLRRGMEINKSMIVPKLISIEDDKRVWKDNESIAKEVAYNG